ncbi:hypothetical protein [Ruminococcus sp.]|uniref:hypothetical protein n=1 Tax=Ruminococcus sp. TaxID=41978 RepID=UPI00258BADE8|nr:hypothetical protein [Ruminococcus sp.]MCR5019506.1 hypothetical protein [Ruminococcus sp.]
MKDFQYTDYGINHANNDAIVYRFANGEVREITAADFGGDENEFRKWKELSDNDLHVEFNHTKRISRRNVSINGLDETDLIHLPSIEEMLVERTDENQFVCEMKTFLELLTDTQKRRLFLAAYYKMGVVEIARYEGVDHKSICETFTNIEKKFKKFLKIPPEKGSKMVVSERLRCYESYFEKATKDLENRKKKKVSGE